MDEYISDLGENIDRNFVMKNPVGEARFRCGDASDEDVSTGVINEIDNAPNEAHLISGQSPEDYTEVSRSVQPLRYI